MFGLLVEAWPIDFHIPTDRLRPVISHVLADKGLNFSVCARNDPDVEAAADAVYGPD